MKAFDILALGSITLDTFIEPSEMEVISKKGKDYIAFEVGQKIRMKTVAKHVGGGAANTGVGFAKMGLNAACIGTIGYDDHGQYILHQLQSRGVNTDFIEIQQRSASSASIIMMQKGGDRTVLNEKAEVKPFPDLPETNAIYAGHLTEEEELVFDHVVEWKQKNPRKFFAWNPGKTQFEQGVDSFEELLSVTDALILNVEEAELFTGIKAQKIPGAACNLPVIAFPEHMADSISEVTLLAEKFLSFGVKNVVITDGKRGAQFFSAEESYLLPLIETTPPVNTLGAGDSFSVGFVSMMLEGKFPQEMMLSGALNATSVVRDFGSQNGLLSRKDLDLLLKKFAVSER